MSLIPARNKKNIAWAVFMRCCNVCGYGDEWEAYRAHDKGVQWSEPLETAWNVYRAALHDFYLLRDGPDGVLGGRGL